MQSRVDLVVHIQECRINHAKRFIFFDLNFAGIAFPVMNLWAGNLELLFEPVVAISRNFDRDWSSKILKS